MIFITIESDWLKALTRHAEHSKLLKFKYLTKTEHIILNRKIHDIQIEVIDIKSVELYTIILYINQSIVGKFSVRGIKTFEVVDERYKITITTERGNMYLIFKN